MTKIGPRVIQKTFNYYLLTTLNIISIFKIENNKNLSFFQ